MGCYMSTPDNRVFVTEGKGKDFTYATASCQGWRREQEDAEDCLPFFDDNASLFVLCDGHGGAEVAKYTVQHLPNFIKDHPLYKEGKYKEALWQSFVDFDALLRTSEVMAELKKMANDVGDTKEGETASKVMELKEEISAHIERLAPSSSAGTSSSNNGSYTIVEDVDTDTLRREAQVPLGELLGEYSTISSIGKPKRSSLLSKFDASPVVRARSDDMEDDDANEEANTSSVDKAEIKEEKSEPSASSTNDEGEPSTSGGQDALKKELIKQVLDRYFPDEDSSDDSEFEGEESSYDEDDDGDDEDDEDQTEGTAKRRRKKHRRPIDNRFDSSSESDSDDDDDDSEDDDEEGYDGEEEEDEDEEDQSFDGEEIDEYETDIIRPGGRPHRPGMDSGCTVVVALIKDGKLYVASAGDSRCIMIMRDGECKPMSFDHKPEDPIERKRIYKAGGRVTEGRVNGGLNLSRALGDFTYKNSVIPAQDQMITPCPDVRIATLDPKEVEYIFLACDGIWNSMKNQQITKFIRKTAPTVQDNLVEICLSIFRNCIAPRTDGDGTGCDNMTCIIAKFENSQDENSTNSDLTTGLENEPKPIIAASHKRSTSDESNNMPNKRRCLSL